MQLAFAADWDGDGEVYAIRVNGSDLTQLTDNTTEDGDPVWSPDGQQIALVADTFHPRLYVVQADGSGGHNIGPDFDVISPDWSPLGDQIAFLDFDDQDIDDLFVVNTITGEVRQLTGDTNIRPGKPQFSPDGRKLAFAASVPGQTPDQRLFVMNTDGTELRPLGAPYEVIYKYTWHPFNDQILFEAWSSSEGTGLYLASMDGSVTKSPIDPGPVPPRAAWSPDGSFVGYIFGQDAFDSQGKLITRDWLRIATPDEEIDVAVIEPPADPHAQFSIWDFAWAPDGRHIAYTIPTAEEVVDLFVLDICDGTSRLIAEDVDSSSTPSWRPLP